MANVYYLDVDGNWNNTANWSSGAVPTTNDNVFIIEGSNDLTINLNQSGVTITDLYRGPGYTGRIGGPGNPLRINGTTSTFTDSYGDFIQGTWTDVIIDAAKPTASTLDGSVVVAGGTVANLVYRDGFGKVLVESGVALTRPTMQAGGGTLIIEASVTGIQDCYQTAGRVLCDSATGASTTKSTIAGGYWRQSTAAPLDVVLTGGEYDYRAKANITGIVDVLGGLFNGSNNRGTSLAIAITRVYRGGRLNLKTGARTWTDGMTILNYGDGDAIQVDPGGPVVLNR